MKILLCAVNTKYIHTSLAVYLLRAYALEHRDPGDESLPDIQVAEYTINQMPGEVMAAIYEQQPDVLLFSCYLWNRRFLDTLLKDLPKVLPDTDIWLGGPEVSFDAPGVLEQYPQLRGILTGEGEETFRELAEEYYAGHGIDPENIRGLCFRNGQGRIVQNAARPLISMDEVPFVYTEELLKQLEHKILYYETSRGCPFGCSYCLSSVDKKVRFRSLDKVFQELQFFLDQRAAQVKFVDRTFNIDGRRSEQILRYLLEHDNGVTNFHFEIAGDILTQEELGIMKDMRPGLIQLEIGVQSVNPQTLRAIHRVTDLDRLCANVEKIRAMGNIHRHLDLIAGLPYEDLKSFSESFDAVYAMRPDQLQLGFLKVLKGSPMEDDARRCGIVYQEQPPYEVLRTEWLSYPELLELKKIEEMVEIYYNSRQFSRTMAVLETAYDSAFRMYRELAEYYEANGYFTRQPSRIYRYQILLEWALLKCPGREMLFRELLTFDLYLRENMKSRPSFAPDASAYKDRLRELKANASSHAEFFRYPVYLEDPREIVVEREEAEAVIFDYEHRDPLDHNARVILIP